MSARQSQQILALSESTNKVGPVKIGGTVPRAEGLGITLVDNDPLLLCVDQVAGKLKVDSSSTGGATEAKQDDQITKLTEIDTAIDSMSAKITACNTGAVVVSSGSITETNSTAILADTDILSGTAYADGDAVSGTDKGILVMGRNGSNTAKPIHITSNGDVEVEIADFVKGQAVMASSFPVVIASNQSAITVDGSASTQPVSGTVSVSGTVTVDGSGVTQPISATALPLPTGASTETTLSALEVHGGNIDTKLPSALDSDRLKIARLFAWDTSTPMSSQVISASGNATSSVVDLSTNGGEVIHLFVDCTTSGTVNVEVTPQYSPDNVTYYDDFFTSISDANSHISLSDLPRYVKFKVDNKDTSDAVTVTINFGQFS